jgi:hypothetical protein
LRCRRPRNAWRSSCAWNRTTFRRTRWC